MSKSVQSSPSAKAKLPTKKLSSARLKKAATTSPTPKTRGGRPSAAEAELLPERMFDAAWELLLEQGFEGFTFDKLAKQARIGKPTIYARFSNKEEFLRALLAHRIVSYQEEVTSVADGLSLREAFELMALKAVLKFVSGEGRLMDRLMDWLEYEGDPSKPSLRRWAFDNARARGEEIIKAGMDRGEVYISDPAHAAQTFLEGIVGHARMSPVREPTNIEPHQRWAEQYVAVILRAFDDRA